MQRLLPPHLFVLCGISSLAIGLLLPVVGPAALPFRLIGVPVLIAGVLLTVRSASHFERAETNIKTFDDPGVLVGTGPFRFSRNPMYLGFTVALVGLSLIVASLSAFAGPALFWLLADRWYIPFEERRMAAAFGPAYRQYRSMVPRWIGWVPRMQSLTP